MHVGAALEQQLHRFALAGARRNLQGGISTSVARLYRCTEIEELPSGGLYWGERSIRSMQPRSAESKSRKLSVRELS